MNREEEIEFIKDQMLVYPTIEADLIYKASFLALFDDYVLEFMRSWMKTPDEGEKIMYEGFLSEEVYGQIDRRYNEVR